MAIKLKNMGDITVEADGVKFVVAAQEYSDIIFAMARPEANELQGSERTIAVGAYILMSRVKGWEGIEDEQGNPIICDEHMKMRLFGQRPDLLNIIGNKVGEIEGESEKNSEASQTG